jgi:hypothetical protein
MATKPKKAAEALRAALCRVAKFAWQRNALMFVLIILAAAAFLIAIAVGSLASYFGADATLRR